MRFTTTSTSPTERWLITKCCRSVCHSGRKIGCSLRSGKSFSINTKTIVDPRRSRMKKSSPM
jgi:hypothetical protein